MDFNAPLMQKSFVTLRFLIFDMKALVPLGWPDLDSLENITGRCNANCSPEP